MTPRAATLLLAGLAALAGCGPPLPPLQARLQPWVGRSEGDLVAAFGVPSATYAVGERKFLQFQSQRPQMVPGDTGWVVGPYGGVATVWGPPTTILVSCEVTFEVRAAVVQGFSFRGPGCR